MHRMLVMAATALVAGSFMLSGALAQQRTAREEDRPTINQIVAQEDARLARLKADLRLKQDQEGDWSKFESAMRAIAKERAERFVAWWDENAKREPDSTSTARPEPITPSAALRAQADAMEKQAADLRKIADAYDPLFQKLDDGQKRQVGQLIGQFAMAPMAQARGPRGRWRGWF